MNLGILVFYLVSEEDEEIFDLHLAQIQKHTQVPYTIYAGANRLAPKLRAKLVGDPHVKICALAATNLRNAAEHSFCLEQLARIAIKDGATHLVTLHTDSFPIRDGWAEELASHLSSTRAFAAIDYGPYSACLFFSRDFYLTHQPRFLLSDNELASEQYKRFSKRFAHINHSGSGFFFKAFCNGLAWFPLVETQKGSALGNIYNDAIFHLHGTARLADTASRSAPPRTVRALYRLRGALRAAVPKRVRRWAWQHFGDTLVRVFDRNVIAYSKQELLENPDAYLEYMRSGKK
jgi:hypothetical protein